MYEAFYKLSAKPFQLSPDPRFFFGSRAHKRAMSYLRYGLTQGEGFIVITGDIGTGKTTLVRTLFEELSQENIVAAQLVTTQLDADDMLRMVAASFGLEQEGVSKATLLKNLEAFLVARTREGKRVLLVVDEVQNLPRRTLEELRMLSNFQIGERALLQSFLLGQEEFREILQSDGMEQLRQRVIAASHLSPLGRDETKAYIEHRLQLVGWKNDPHFTDEAFEEIHHYTDGIPRRINTLCDRMLLFGFLEEAHEINANTVRYVTDELLQETSNPRAQVAVAASRHGQGGTEDVRAAAVDLSEVERRLGNLEAKIAAIEKELRKDRVRLLEALLAKPGRPVSREVEE